MKQRPSVIIVDDDADDQDIIRDAFFAHLPEAEYLFAENGERLMDLLEACSVQDLPSLILIDLNMPAKDGRQTLKEIKENPAYRAIPTLVFTTSSSLRDQQNAYSLGANCFITKPDTYNKMVELAGCISRLWLLG